MLVVVCVSCVFVLGKRLKVNKRDTIHGVG